MPLDVVQLLAELVACSSANPRRNPPGGDSPGEANLCRILDRLLNALGARVEQEEVLPGRRNLFGTFTGRDPSRTLLLAAHADTVPQDGMTIPPFTPSIRNGRLYGRGSADTKGSMAAMLAALSRFLEKNGAPPCNVCFAATCNEEFGAHGAKALVRRHPGEFFGAVVGEPTDLAVVHAHKGALRFSIEARGLAVHSSLPERGASAIFAMSDVVRRLEGPYREELLRRDHPLLGPPRVTVGIIRGGSQVNIVPDHCLVEVDRRTVPGETLDSARGELDAILAEAKHAGDPRIAFSCQSTDEYPPLDEPADGPIGRLAGEACRRVLGQARFAAAPYATDAGVFHHAGLPAVVLGPGSMQQAHTQDEFIGLEPLRQAVDVYETLIGLAGRPV